MRRKVACYERFKQNGDAEEERKKVGRLKKPKPKLFSKKPSVLATRTESNERRLKLQKNKPAKKLKLRYKLMISETNLRIVTLREECTRKRVTEANSMIIEFKSLTQLTHGETRSISSILKNQEDWKIIRWRLNESSGVHTLELEDGTMLHMLAERRYPLSRELMIRMLDHGMEVEDESEIAITLIHLFILWTTEDGDDS
ncbi:hypothetical protein Tco_0819874 [Tanacetum coccineum]|uniref:Uncharacterized protein n=1 Tax=Tanacetum coccineum TaxID=301880 RepID=A0ABQ5A7U5_9ASTR